MEYKRNFTEGLSLIEPDIIYVDEIKKFREEFIFYNSSMDGLGPLKRLANPLDWIKFCQDAKDEKTMHPMATPTTQLMYVRESDNRIIGMIQIRHSFNEVLEKYGGNIGYSIRPSERRKGYATSMLADCLEKCKVFGMEKVLLTCEENNIASEKTIINNNGIYESNIYWPERGEMLKRYWIIL